MAAGTALVRALATWTHDQKASLDYAALHR